MSFRVLVGPAVIIGTLAMVALSGFVLLFLRSPFMAIPLFFAIFPVLFICSVAMSLYERHLERTDLERYQEWTWWVNLISGILGTVGLGAGMMIALSLLMHFRIMEIFWFGAILASVGAAFFVYRIIRLVAILREGWPKTEHLDTEAFQEWLDGDGPDDNRR